MKFLRKIAAIYKIYIRATELYITQYKLNKSIYLHTATQKSHIIRGYGKGLNQEDKENE